MLDARTRKLGVNVVRLCDRVQCVFFSSRNVYNERARDFVYLIRARAH